MFFDGVFSVPWMLVERDFVIIIFFVNVAFGFAYNLKIVAIKLSYCVLASLLFFTLPPTEIKEKLFI